MNKFKIILLIAFLFIPQVLFASTPVDVSSYEIVGGKIDDSNKNAVVIHGFYIVPPPVSKVKVILNDISDYQVEAEGDVNQETGEFNVTIDASMLFDGMVGVTIGSYENAFFGQTPVEKKTSSPPQAGLPILTLDEYPEITSEASFEFKGTKPKNAFIGIGKGDVLVDPESLTWSYRVLLRPGKNLITFDCYIPGSRGCGRVTAEIEFTGNPVAFFDIADHWAKEFINKLFDAGVITGYPDRTFRPNQPVTRAEFLKMTLAAKKIDPPDIDLDVFSDLDFWQKKWVYYAYQNEIVQGIAQGFFEPNRPVTRAEAVKILLLSFKPEISGTLILPIQFIDIKNHWAKEFIENAAKLEIVSGYPGGFFRPNKPITRAEAAKIISTVTKT